MHIHSPLHLLILFVFLFAVAMVTAMLEIQIEGKNGWAKKLPTWRMQSAFYKRFANRTEITGYHMYLGLFLLLMFHFPMLLLGWSWFAEWTVLSLYFAFNILWDFLWFVLNPAFGWKRYSKENIWWFQRWMGPFPSDYYGAMLLSGVLAALRGATAEATGTPNFASISIPIQHVLGWAMGITLCVTGCAVLIVTHISAHTVRKSLRTGLQTIKPVSSSA